MRRREFLQLPAVAALPHAGPRKKIAALTTTYHGRSHADDIITRFLTGSTTTYYASFCDIVSMYIDQVLQCFVERRKGGENGVRRVQHIQGDEVWRAAEQG